MASTSRDLRDDEILRFLRFSVTESAAATYTEVSYDTQLSIDRGLIWMIHSVEFDITLANVDQPAAGANENLAVQIMREPQSDISNFADPDLIYLHTIFKDRGAAIGTDAGPVIFGAFRPFRVTFPIPIPYAAQAIHIGIKSTNAAATSSTGRIGYVLRRVTDKFFYRVAQALIS
jgi:hypothetical protein